ncbi:MAG: glycoside hydrolase 3 protein [Peltula sp. TS41687]|nr:MAG: glycoside hydrolase 3 protein [Peltula sp. TS41687]
MHVATTSSIIALGLTLAPAAVSATGRLGFALGTKLPYADFRRGDPYCKTTADYEADFDALKGYSTLVRGYAADDCNFAQQVLPAAKNKGFKVILGIWADTDSSYNSGKAAVQTYANQFPDQVYAVTVGSETLYRGNFTGDELMQKINDVNSVIPSSIKVGTADSWNKYADGTADPVIRGAEILLINAFAYWQGQEIGNATATFLDDIQQAMGRVQSIRGSLNGVEIMVGETGWPTAGGTYGSAVPSTPNAQTFWKRSVCGMRAWGVDVFAFEAFDEPWKPVSVGDNGESRDETHWGVFNADRSFKYDVRC